MLDTHCARTLARMEKLKENGLFEGDIDFVEPEAVEDENNNNNQDEGQNNNQLEMNDAGNN